jgi:hypothetical protein
MGIVAVEGIQNAGSRDRWSLAGGFGRAAPSRGAALALAALISGVAVPAVAQDATWRGVIRCEAVAGATETPLNVPASVVVRRGVASFERPIRSPQGGRTGLWERWEARPAADGAVVFAGEMSGRGWVMRARYAGVLAGSEATLSGEQVWELERGPQTRPCTVTLRRE